MSVLSRTLPLIAVIALVVLSGCARRAQPAALPAPMPPAPVAEAAPPTPPPPPAAAPAAPAALSEDELFARKSLDELNAERPLATVLFDYDQWTIRDDARSMLQRNAAWLQRWPSTRVVVEGHADERGTSEYNFALGERRAQAVRDYLIGLGTGQERITLVSKGREEPTCRDQVESCWQQNRRGQFVITAK